MAIDVVKIPLLPVAVQVQPAGRAGRGEPGHMQYI